MNEPRDFTFGATSCPEDWDAMEQGRDGRHCASCSTHVYDFSSMTRDQVRKLLAEREGLHTCARFRLDEDGRPLHLDSPDPTWRLELQLEGAKKLLAAALVIPLLAACDTPSEPPAGPTAVSPIALDTEHASIDGTYARPGASAVPEAPEPPKSVHDDYYIYPFVKKDLPEWVPPPSSRWTTHDRARHTTPALERCEQLFPLHADAYYLSSRVSEHEFDLPTRHRNAKLVRRFEACLDEHGYEAPPERPQPEPPRRSGHYLGLVSGE